MPSNYNVTEQQIRLRANCIFLAGHKRIPWEKCYEYAKKSFV